MLLLSLALAIAPLRAPKTALVAECAPVGGEVSARLAEKVTEMLRAELGAAGVSVLSRADVDRLREGAVALRPPDLSAARAALEQGKLHYLNLEFERASERLAVARRAYEDALPQSGEFAPLAEALAYAGAS